MPPWLYGFLCMGPSRILVGSVPWASGLYMVHTRYMSQGPFFIRIIQGLIM